jgi:hypothetical protein
MRLQKYSTAFIAVVILLLFSLPASAQGLEFTGQILTGTGSRKEAPRFNIKLYPPKTSRKPILMTNSDAFQKFKFTGLGADSYLLEIYLGDDLVYQEVITLSENVHRKIDLRKK